MLQEKFIKCRWKLRWLENICKDWSLAVVRIKWNDIIRYDRQIIEEWYPFEYVEITSKQLLCNISKLLTHINNTIVKTPNYRTKRSFALWEYLYYKYYYDKNDYNNIK